MQTRCLMQITLTFAWLLVFGHATAAQTVIGELKEPLFEEVRAALAAANESRAALLSPTAYAEAGDLYRRAEKTLADGGSLESIRRDLGKATKLFTQSTKSSGIADAAFGGTLRARADAENSEAQTYAPDDWRAAEEKFASATNGLEKGRKRTAERSAEQALELYRSAELNAIKANYLNETRSLLEDAEERRAERYAPKSFANASRLLLEAETSLNDDRYDTDKPRSLAQQAKHAANHAIYVSRLADRQRDDKITLEDILLDWEASLSQLADQVDTPVHYDNGQAKAVADIQNAMVNLQSQVALQTNGLSERDEQIAALNSQVTELQTKLGTESEAAQQLNQVLAQQERNRMRFAAVERLFTMEQANVLRKGNTVIVRMIGLTFDSGSASLKAEHETSLDRLNQAIDEFPGAKIVIEGHTDAYGSDAQNLDLSQRRADSVESYLQTKGLDAANLTALGYGESQPVANNESAEGRRRNRRIDVVIYPPQ